MPPRRAVELRVGGQTYRVVGSENDPHVQRLAALVDRKFAEVVPQGRGVTGQQAMFLIAMALAEEAEEQRARAARLEAERDRSVRLASRARAVVARLLERVDGVLASLPPDASKQPAAGDGPRELRQAPPRDGRQTFARDAHPSPTSALSAPPLDPSPVDPLTEPPDILREQVLIELMPPSTRDPSWSSIPPPSALPPPSGPSNETAIPPGVRQSLPHSERQSLPRPGLRLVRRGSTPDDEHR